MGITIFFSRLQCHEHKDFTHKCYRAAQYAYSATVIYYAIVSQFIILCVVGISCYNERDEIFLLFSFENGKTLTQGTELGFLVRKQIHMRNSVSLHRYVSKHLSIM